MLTKVKVVFNKKRDNSSLTLKIIPEISIVLFPEVINLQGEDDNPLLCQFTAECKSGDTIELILRDPEEGIVKCRLCNISLISVEKDTVSFFKPLVT